MYTSERIVDIVQPDMEMPYLVSMPDIILAQEMETPCWGWKQEKAQPDTLEATMLWLATMQGVNQMTSLFFILPRLT